MGLSREVPCAGLALLEIRPASPMPHSRRAIAISVSGVERSLLSNRRGCATWSQPATKSRWSKSCDHTRISRLAMLLQVLARDWQWPSRSLWAVGWPVVPIARGG